MNSLLFIKNKRFIISVIILAVFLLGFFVLSNTVLAEDGANGGKKALDGLDTTAKGGYGVEVNKLATNIPDIVGMIVGAVLEFVGLLFFVLIIWAGFIWMTAGGSEEKVKESVDLIIRASFGLLIISAAYLIAQFVGANIILPFVT